MTRNELYDIIDFRGIGLTSRNEIIELIWGQAFDGETEKITKKDEGENHEITKLRLKMAHDAIRIAVDAFDAINMWEGYCGSTDMITCLKDFLPIPAQPNTTKLASSTYPVTEREDHETAEQKVAWLTEILVVKAGDPVFTDYWLRLARRNLLLGLPLKTEEPDLNSATEDSSATGSEPLPNGITYTRSYQVFLPTPTQPKP